MGDRVGLARSLAEPVAQGIPRERILLDLSANTTREEAMLLGPLLRAHGIETFALVASSIHMRRALATVEAAGLHPAPAPSAVFTPWVEDADWRFVPQIAALRLNYEISYEYLAFALYRSRGWLAPAE